ncbi:MAG: adenylosuccinate synthase [Fimbriimonadaceae bacterium]|nr:adenylosuccinate synthase [Chitinophagales bacterium]
MNVDVLLGLQWGDEGKGKVVDYLAEQYDVVARFQGGPNAGHTLILKNGVKFVLHTIPSGIFLNNCMNVVGGGVVIDPVTFKMEVDKLENAGVDVKKRLLISRKAHLILPTHKMLDAASEASKGLDKIGSTLKGIGPAYMDKTGRNGLRIGDIETPNFKEKYDRLKEKHFLFLKNYENVSLEIQNEKEWLDAIEFMKQIPFIDSEYYLNDQIIKNKKILAEGAQGSMLDVDHGTYPFVTSSNTITAGVCTGLGIAPQRIKEVIGISKAYCTRVGGGPFPTELFDQTGEELRKIGSEFGAVTKRPRRCGWIDLPALKYTIMLNGVTQIAITKIDVLNTFKEIKACVAYKIKGKQTDHIPFNIVDAEIEPVYETFKGWNCNLDNCKTKDDLPIELRNFLQFLERELKVKITMLSSGPEREKLILL